MKHEFHLISVFPDFLSSYTQFGVVGRAIALGTIDVNVVNLRDFGLDLRGSVDDAPYGGGDGMVMRPEPLAKAVSTVGNNPRVILPSPQGKPFSYRTAEDLASETRPLVFVCARFAGVDQRFIDRYVDDEFSIGDVVVSGGELPALLMLDAIVRQIPGSLGNQDSARNDSFGVGMGHMLEHPLYTRPPVFEGCSVPEVLTSGNHAAIEAWRRLESFRRTTQRRPDLAPENAD